MKLLYSAIALCTMYLLKSQIGIQDSAFAIRLDIGQAINNQITAQGSLFYATKQILFGLPEVVVFSVINKLCTMFLAGDVINPLITPRMETMAFSLRTPCRRSRFPLNNAEIILKSPDFNVKYKLAIFVPGWMSSSESDYVSNLATAFLCRGDYNFLAFDTSDSIKTLYTWSAYNTEEVGRQLAIGLKKLLDQFPAKNIHLIGHSLGAHIVGYAGRYFTKLTGLNLTRITGLDPANPCFNKGRFLSGLQRGDAEFVDIIHSNPGGLGKKEPIGDVDFYPGGLDPIKPGCTKFGCSHGRAYEYFIESVYRGNEKNFLGVCCTSLRELKEHNCKGNKFPMGYAVPHNLKGNFYVPVNAKKPFGQNSDNNYAKTSTCGKC